MGMYDSVFVKCPECGTDLEFQSKRGECLLNEYTIYDAPPDILTAIAQDEKTCPGCDKVVAFQMVVRPQLLPYAKRKKVL